MATAVDQHLHERIRALADELERASARSERLCGDTRRLLAGAGNRSYPRWFLVEGEIEGWPCRARWWRGSLVLPPVWEQRAALVVSLGEAFSLPGRAEVRARLDEPLAAMLTIIRACDLPRSITFGPAEQPSHGVPPTTRC